MTKIQFRATALLGSLALPLAAILPYAFLGRDLRILRWAWSTGYWPFWLTLIFALVAAFFTFLFLCRFQRLGTYIFRFATALITVSSSIVAMLEHRHLLLVLVFFVTALLVWLGEWFRSCLDLPFYNQRISWWEAHPKGVPWITVVVYDQERKIKEENVRVSNFGAEGCYVFCTTGPWKFEPAYIEIEFDNGSNICAAVKPVIYTRAKQGVGLRFLEQASGDWSKDMMDHIDGLRRSGYVSG